MGKLSIMKLNKVTVYNNNQQLHKLNFTHENQSVFNQSAPYMLSTIM